MSSVVQPVPKAQELLPLSDVDVVQAVNDAYSAKAKAGADPTYAANVAKAFGYTEEELSSIPDEANMGLSCGNPVGTARIKEGEYVLDLGSGGGIDVFLAASKVGPTGQVIGLDMSLEMINLARRNAEKQNLKPPHVAFVQASLEKELPVESDSIDCILSNCVVNLLHPAGKVNLLKEAYRVLKPGGRIVLDDILARALLPDDIKKDLNAYIACISGAVQEHEYKQILVESGFSDVLLVDTKSDLNVYFQSDSIPASESRSCCSTTQPPSQPRRPDFDVNKWAASYQIYAVKSGVPTQHVSSALRRWWDAYPTVKSSAPSLTPDDVASLIRDPTKTGSDYAVIDVRRNDHGGGHVRGSHQWAAQTFYDDLPAFYEKFKDTKQVIFYCSSSAGRGPRCGGWYQDYLETKGSQSTSTAYVLEGGVKAWFRKFRDQEELVDED